MHGAGCVITAGILGSGFSQFKAGNKKASQFFMRARVVAQARLSVIESLVSVQIKRGKQTNKDKDLTPDP